MKPRPAIGYIEIPHDEGVTMYCDPVEVVETADVDGVWSAMLLVEDWVAKGYTAVGYVAYEAAAAFDSAFTTHTPNDMPLLWFGLYKEGHELPRRNPAPPLPPPHWTPSVDRAGYDAAIASIRAHIAAGDTYQVNYTFPMTADFELEGLAWFHDRQHAQRGAHRAYLNLGRHEIVSLSPELFFGLDGTTLQCRPMKGTRPRGLSAAKDRALAKALRYSEKEQAENLMVVDMLRNDMGRICETGSVSVPSLYDIEQHLTVWQMTSTIIGKTEVSIPEIFRALFPCASVTGAPKIETMKLIHRLEKEARGVYCGAIGRWSPGRRAEFSVAIRTAVIDTEQRRIRYPVGSGITWDSIDAQEYEECESKTMVLRHNEAPFELLTSMLLDEAGYFLFGHHLERLENSVVFFGFKWDRDAIEKALLDYASVPFNRPAKVRLTLDKQGMPSISHTELPPPTPWNVGLALTPIDTKQTWVYHKTTQRSCYDEARATRPECTDVVLATKDGFLTEATFANLVLEIDGELFTPPASQGLLEGVYRRHLLAEGTIKERVLTVEDLDHATKIHLINSVRRWIPVVWQPHPIEENLVQNAR